MRGGLSVPLRTGVVRCAVDLANVPPLMPNGLVIFFLDFFFNEAKSFPFYIDIVKANIERPRLNRKRMAKK
jgi:hypothetical protein